MYKLKDEQWKLIKDLLPGRPGHVGVTAKDNRLFIDAVLYRHRAGIAWRELPAHFGDFRVVHLRYSRWRRSGVWALVVEALSREQSNPFKEIGTSLTQPQRKQTKAPAPGSCADCC